jgi:hypothetical protein
MATPSRPTFSRAWFIIVNMQARPWCSSPTSQPIAPGPSPKLITAVALARMPILCSMEAQTRSLRSPRLPSALTRNFGQRNSEMPFTPAGASGSRASTRWTMFSAMSCSPQVMKILVPLMR